MAPEVEILHPNSKLNEPLWIPWNGQEPLVAAFAQCHAAKLIIERWDSIRALVEDRVAYISAAAIDCPDFPRLDERAAAHCLDTFRKLPAIALTRRLENRAQVEIITLAWDTPTAQYLADEAQAALARAETRAHRPPRWPHSAPQAPSAAKPPPTAPERPSQASQRAEIKPQPPWWRRGRRP